MSSVFDNISFSGHAYHEDLFTDLNDSMAMNDFGPLSHESSFGDMQPNTVSPKDLFAEDFATSAPPSTAFPPLNTPGSEFLDSPALTGGLDTTPMDAFLELNGTDIEQWPSLFPEESTGQFIKPLTASPAIAQHNSFDSLTTMSPLVAQPAPTMTRQKSSPGRPPMTPAHLRKHSLTSGINKSAAAAKARKSLPDILVDSEDDKETAKRKKNTAAARKSRERKQMIVDSQADEINRLTVENERLKAMVFALGGNPES